MIGTRGLSNIMAFIFMTIIIFILFAAYVLVDDFMMTRTTQLKNTLNFDTQKAADTSTAGLTKVQLAWNYLPWLVGGGVLLMALYAAFSPTGQRDEY